MLPALMMAGRDVGEAVLSEMETSSLISPVSNFVS